MHAGGLFGGYEWCMTDKYDSKNVDHVRIKEGIEVGNGLPTLVHYSQIVKDLENSGFEVVDSYDANRGTYICSYIHCSYIHMLIHTQIYIYIYIYMLIPTYAHTYIHTYIRTCRCS